MDIQRIIKDRRKELDLTLKDVAAALNVSEGTISRYESGDIHNMGIDKIQALANVLRCTPGYLMGWEDDPNYQQAHLENDALFLDSAHQLNQEGQAAMQKYCAMSQEKQHSVNVYIDFINSTEK